MALPKRFAYLTKDPPLMVAVAMGLYGTYEIDGSANNKTILAWADEVERNWHNAYNAWAADFYNSDKIPWCGLFMAVCATRSTQGRPERAPPKNYLAALSWSAWGKPVAKKLENVLVGDIIVLTNPTHVTMAVGVTNKGTILGLGGNQSNSVNIKEFPLSRVYAIRRPPYKVLPVGARHVVVGSTGEISTNER